MGAHTTALTVAGYLGYCYGGADLVSSLGCSCCGLDTCAFGPVSDDTQRSFVSF